MRAFIAASIRPPDDELLLPRVTEGLRAGDVGERGAGSISRLKGEDACA